MKEGIDTFFEHYLNAPSIFKDKSVFLPNFIPPDFSHRDEQITHIANILAPSLRNQKSSNIFIYGKTGTGKTLSILYITSNMTTIANERRIPLSIISVNCKLRRVADTEYRLIAELARQLGQDVAATGLPTEEVYDLFVTTLESRKHTIILILDEIDHLLSKVGSGILYNLTRLNSTLKHSQICIVGISNDIMFTEGLDPRVKSSLSEEEVIFTPYNALQLQNILNERAQLAFHSNIVDAGVIEKCAAFAAREHGDARRAIELLRVAGEIAEREQATTINLSHLDTAKDKIERDRIEDIAGSQPKQYQAVLLSILRLSMHRTGLLFTGEVYEVYSRICQHAGLRPLTQRRVSDILSEYDMLGIINAKIISKGRYGRMREIHTALPPTSQQRICTILERSLDLASTTTDSTPEPSPAENQQATPAPSPHQDPTPNPPAHHPRTP